MGQNVHEGGYRIRRYVWAVVEAPATFYPYLSGRANQGLLVGSQVCKEPQQRIRSLLARLELLAIAG